MAQVFTICGAGRCFFCGSFREKCRGISIFCGVFSRKCRGICAPCGGVARKCGVCPRFSRHLWLCRGDFRAVPQGRDAVFVGIPAPSTRQISQKIAEHGTSCALFCARGGYFWGEMLLLPLRMVAFVPEKKQKKGKFLAKKCFCATFAAVIRGVPSFFAGWC